MATPPPQTTRSNLPTGLRSKGGGAPHYSCRCACLRSRALHVAPHNHHHEGQFGGAARLDIPTESANGGHARGKATGIGQMVSTTPHSRAAGACTLRIARPAGHLGSDARRMRQRATRTERGGHQPAPAYDARVARATRVGRKTGDLGKELAGRGTPCHALY